MVTTQTVTVKKAGTLLSDVLAHLAARPYNGPELPIGDIAFQQHYNNDDDTRTVSLLGDAPDIIGISVALLEHVDPQFVTFRGGLLILNVQPQPLLYRPLYLGRDAHVVMLERVCSTCRGREKMPDFSQGLDPVYGEPKGKPCPGCSAGGKG